MYQHKNGIILRKVTQEDATGVLLDLKQEDWWGTHKTLICNEADQIKWFNSIPSNELYLMCLYENMSVGLAALSGIDNYNRAAKASGSILKKHQGSTIPSLAAEAGIDFAFEILNLHRLESEFIEYNIPSRKIQLDLGFQIEGLRKQAVLKSSQYYDSYFLAILRNEWQNSERVKAYGNSCNSFDHEKMKKLSERFN